MRFIVDECTGPAVARWLGAHHDVFSVYDEAIGVSDEAIMRKAFTENWIVITNDKDFGEKVYRERYPHKGVIFLRLDNETPINKIAVLQRLLARYADQLADQFVVVAETHVRFARIMSGE